MSSVLKTMTSTITKRPYWWMYSIGLVIVLASFWLWWTQVYLSPHRVFWSMFENGLSTRGVTVQTAQSSNQGSVKQTVQFELGQTNKAHSLTTLTQGATKVRTEIIGTHDADYTRYMSIDTDQKNAAGKPIDTSKVVGVWTKSNDTPQTETQSSGHQLLAQAALGVGLPIGSVPVPIGEMPAKARADLLAQIRSLNLYETSFAKVEKRRVDGRLRYTYHVKIQTVPYVRVMKAFGAQIGLHELDKVDPNSYQTADAMQVKLVVDARSRQLLAVEREGAGYTQSYSGYGTPVTATIPAKTINASELQQRLKTL
jgi:hypothetical protein